MSTHPLTSVDENRLRDLELGTTALTRAERSGELFGDHAVRRYIDILPPSAALELIDTVRTLRRALNGAMLALERAGYTIEAYCGLDERERANPTWRAVREAWEATGEGPRYLLRFSPGPRQAVRAYPTKRAALEAAIEALEMCEGYPTAIELEGGTRLMNCAEILSAWEDRHDPG